MELHNALQHIIQTDGKDILKELRLINILDDLTALKNMPASKYILRAIIADGYMDKFLTIGDWNCQTKDMIHRFSISTGFIESIVHDIFQSIAYGLGWCDYCCHSFTSYNVCKSQAAPQSSNTLKCKHAVFKGMEINGTREEFTESAKKIGLRPSSLEGDNFSLYFGTFADVENCDFRVEFSPFSGQAYEVQVWMPSQDSWQDIKNRYYDFKDRLTAKYGKPSSSHEYFEFPYNYEDGSGNEMEFLRNNKIVYCSYFKNEFTTIELKIHQFGDVHVTYEDKVNADFHYSKANEVLNSDL